LEDDPDEYEIEEVRDRAVIKGKLRYLVKWKGWPSEYNQWVIDDDMDKAQEAIKSFEKRKGRRDVEKNVNKRRRRN